jgi:hypothetical protein
MGFNVLPKPSCPLYHLTHSTSLQYPFVFSDLFCPLYHLTHLTSLEYPFVFWLPILSSSPPNPLDQWSKRPFEKSTIPHKCHWGLATTYNPDPDKSVFTLPHLWQCQQALYYMWELASI